VVDPSGAEMLRELAEHKEQARYEVHDQFHALWTRIASGGAYEKPAWNELWRQLQWLGVQPSPGPRKIEKG
jgi:hypothetical protein